MTLGNESTLIRQETGFEMSGDGYDWAQYRPDLIANWGAHGWDVGDWPYVIVCAGRNKAGEYYTLTRVEGDLTYRYFANPEARDRDLDLLAEYHWRQNPERHGDGMVKAVKEHPLLGTLPDHFHGRRTKNRCPDYPTCPWREDLSDLHSPVVRAGSAAHFVDLLGA